MISLRDNNNIILYFDSFQPSFAISKRQELFDTTLLNSSKQVMEMTEIIDGTIELISSIMNLRINHIIKSLTSITIIFTNSYDNFRNDIMNIDAN